MEPQTPFGVAHLIAQSDAVGKGLLLLLLAMSVVSWTVILVKALSQWRQRSRAAGFLGRYANAPSLGAVREDLRTNGAHDPFARLAGQALDAHAHLARLASGAPTRLAEAGTAGDYVTRTLRQGLDDEAVRLESGLTLLATVGATAPFVGLFGTVWGVYHALVAIGVSGSGTLDKVAGPVGEALIMTGLGLAVAIPAVMAYNAFTRRIRVVTARLDAFAFELHSHLTLGASPVHALQQASVASGSAPHSAPTRSPAGPAAAAAA